MSHIIRYVVVGWLVCVGMNALVDCAYSQAAGKLKAENDLEIHEWGVFTAPRNSYWLKQDMLAEWSSFPDFFHGVWPKTKLAYYGPVTKPVIYFHTKSKLNLQLQIDFTTGRPLIWWPPAEFPNTGGFGQRKSLTKTRMNIDPDKSLLFNLQINQGMPNKQQVDAKHWLNHLRKVNSAPLSAHGGFSNFGRGRHGEHFVYYDGVMKCPKAPTVERIDGGIRLKSDSDHDWLDVVVIERTGDEIRIASSVIKKIAAGKHETKIKLIKSTGVKDLANDLRQRMIDVGLHKDEAQSLLDVWGPGLLERGGLTVFYRIAQKTYDKWLPLATEPAAKKTVRVGWVVHFRLEPELDARVKQLVAQLGSRKYKVRADADKQLREIGGPAFPAIIEAAKKADAEVRLRCEKILAVKKLEQKLRTLMKQRANGNSR